MDRRTALLAPLVLGALGTAALSGCDDGFATSAAGPSDGEGTTRYPLEFTDCEATLTFDAAPERVVLLETAPVTILDGIGVLDTVVAKAGVFSPAYYRAQHFGDLAERVAAIDVLSDDINGAGHLQINQEVVIARSPDLVLGLPDGVTREGLSSGGAQVLVQNVYCDGAGPADWDDLFDEVRQYGRIFDRQQAADQLVSALDERLDTVRDGASSRKRMTAAVLYPTVGGGPLYTYGAASMATPQLDAVGLDNVFASSSERVFEVSSEALIDADPDHLIVLHQDEGDGSDVLTELERTAGTADLAAVQDGRVRAQLFNFTEPASPLVVDGAEQLAHWLSELHA
ncbi:ABC transporter substrate-binding protein [Brachybacterium kimchii]|uniref:ABC transporter substrate-binding protein n=1 Tax=Brachybacterium kimchii TaxID=2942909 RepID=A0ABY4N3Y2_9MICO|nr:ABC transporter substrate-binding protein [Brachybacterium kimchii]UQN29268.1 ABC transporter substrate-binding protein [Brachybacterium kimchii]